MEKATSYYQSFALCTALLSIISGLYLGVPIHQINKLIKEKQLQVNTKIMMVHAATFGIYVLSIIIGELAFLLCNTNKSNIETLILIKFCSAIT